MKMVFKVTSLKIKHNPFAKAFLETKDKPGVVGHMGMGGMHDMGGLVKSAAAVQAAAVHQAAKDKLFDPNHMHHHLSPCKEIFFIS